jgi:hypothetical protein
MFGALFKIPHELSAHNAPDESLLDISIRSAEVPPDLEWMYKSTN